MKRVSVFCVAVVATSALALPDLRAQEKDAPRGYIYYTPANGSGTTYRFLAPSRDQPTTRRAIYVPQQTAPTQRSEAAQVRQRVIVRPVNWGPRSLAAYLYPTVAYGQYVQAPGQPAAEAQGAYGGTAPYPAGINPYKYSYPANDPGGYSYAPVYNSGYYTSGCYQENACCRCSRRRCTLFGGMAYGCGAGCYTMIPPPCPTACAYGAPYGNVIAPPANGAPMTAPSTAPPTPAPPTPAPQTDDGAPPQPIEKRVSPAPQANLFPRIPGLPPDA